MGCIHSSTTSKDKAKAKALASSMFYSELAAPSAEETQQVMGCRHSSPTGKAKASASSMFYRELPVPSVATGAIIGNNGNTIRSLQNTRGISSVKLYFGRVEIRGVSEEAVQGVVMSIERLLCDAVSRSKEYHPDFFVTCFCKSLVEPFSAINRICFQKFTGEICSGDREVGKSYFCVRTRAICDKMSGAGSGSSIEKSCHDMNSLSAQFSSKMDISESVICSYWDFSAYKTMLLSCLKSLQLKTEHKTIKLVIRFGKLLFDIGPDLSKSVNNGDFISLSRLQELNVERKLHSFFTTACSDTAVRDVKLHLERLQYVKISSVKKISIHVADVVQGQLQRYYVSVRCEMSNECPLSLLAVSSSHKFESPTGAVITRVRRLPMRHGFVTFSREGQTTSDFQLGVATHEMDHLNDIDIPPGMVEWVKKAWRDRTPDQLLVFPPPGRFLIINIRYRNIETYSTEDFKFRISQVTRGDRINMMGNKIWKCKLSSRWFKSNYGVPGAHTLNSCWEDVDSAVETDVGALINEAVKFSEVISP